MVSRIQTVVLHNRQDRCCGVFPATLWNIIGGCNKDICMCVSVRWYSPLPPGVMDLIIYNEYHRKRQLLLRHIYIQIQPVTGQHHSLMYTYQLILISIEALCIQIYCMASMSNKRSVQGTTVIWLLEIVEFNFYGAKWLFWNYQDFMILQISVPHRLWGVESMSLCEGTTWSKQTSCFLLGGLWSCPSRVTSVVSVTNSKLN